MILAMGLLQGAARDSSPCQVDATAAGSGRERRVSRKDVAMPPDKPDCRQLVEAARQGDRDAFTRLYAQTNALLWYVAWQFAEGRRDLAEDLTQKMWLRIWRALPQFLEGKAPWPAWASSVARSTAIDDYRSRHPKARPPDVSLEQMAASGIVPAAKEQEPTFPPHLVEEIEAFVATLSEAEQEVYRLRKQGMVCREIAETLQESGPAVRSRYYRVLEKIRRKYPEYFENQPPEHDRSGALDPSQEPTDEV